MCEPATVGAVLTGIGLFSEGMSARSQAKKQAGINEEQAAREREISKTQAEDFKKRQSKIMAELRAASGRSGIETGTGSPLITSKDFAAETALQAQRIREGGELRGTRLEQQANLLRRSGRAAFRTGIFRGGASLLTGFKERE